MKKVLIPIDWSENAEKAFDWYIYNLYHKGVHLFITHFIEASKEKDLQEKEMKLMELQEVYETRLLQMKIELQTGALNALIPTLSVNSDSSQHPTPQPLYQPHPMLWGPTRADWASLPLVDYTWLTGNSGSPGEFIIKVAKEEDVDMIIMGARGLGKIKKTILGSVSDHVLSKSKVPVLIFKGM